MKFLTSFICSALALACTSEASSCKEFYIGKGTASKLDELNVKYLQAIEDGNQTKIVELASEKGDILMTLA